MRSLRSRLPICVLAFAAVILFAATMTAQNFTEQSYPAPAAQHIRQANLNNDAYPDLILFGDNQANPYGGSNPGTPLAVMLNDGKGGFLPATVLDQNGTHTVAAVVADFNGDGLMDIAACATPAGNNQNYLNIWINQGGGKFTLAHTINIPDGCATIAAGDANKDGIPDVVVAAHDSGEKNSVVNVIITYFGDGTGNFPTNVEQSLPPDLSGKECGTEDIAGADFDNDGILDLVIVTGCYYSNNSSVVWYAKGDGTGNYTATQLFASNDNLTVDEPYVADVNGDGKPDVILVGKPASASSSPDGGELDFLINDGNGSFTNATVFQVASPDQIFAGAAGNFNGDNYQDAVVGYTKSGQPALAWLNGTSTPGAYGTATDLPTPGGFPIGLATADFNNSGQTGIAALEQTSSGANSIVVYLNNTTTGGACTAPSAPGVNICSPTAGSSPSSPVNFVASGTGASGSVNHLELWIDGQKVGNYTGATMNTTVPLNNGSHTVTVVEVDSKGAYVKSSPDTFTVNGTSGGNGGGGCEGPSSPGVNVCSPIAGSTGPSPITFIATGTGASGQVNHLELWVDGQKIGNYPGASMNASVTLAAGSHSATVVEVDSQLHYVKSSPVNFTVGTSGGNGGGNGCAPPSSAGAVICTPTASTPYSSPVQFTGSGTGASGSVNHLELWIDGSKVGNYPGSTLDTFVTLTSGAHTATLVEVDSQMHYVKSAPVNFTVQ